MYKHGRMKNDEYYYILKWEDKMGR